MKTMKIYISIIIILTIVLPICVLADASLTKTILVNVAQNKPITGGKYNATMPLTLLNDGNRKTMIYNSDENVLTDNSNGVPSSTETFWFQIDLLRRFNIEKIELYSRYDMPDTQGARQYFNILASNSPDFADAATYTVLGGVQALDDSVFPHQGVFTINLDGLKAFRYIKMQRNGGWYHGYSEFKVYAKQTVTEVSRNKPVAANGYNIIGTTHYSPDLAVNGTNLNLSDCWLMEDVAKYYFLRIDLGQQYPIGMIEMEDRYGNLNVDTRNRINLYGSNSFVDNATHEANATLTTAQGYTHLGAVGWPNDYKVDSVDDFPFPLLSNGVYQLICNDTQDFQYITYKKDEKLPAALGQIRAYVINPVLNQISLEGKNLSLEFSDVMDLTTLNNNNIKLFVGNTEISYLSNIPDEYSYEMQLEEQIFNTDLRVEVSAEVKNIEGVNMSSNYIKNIATPNAIDVEQFEIVNSKEGIGIPLQSLLGATEAGANILIKNNSSGKAETAIVIAALYNQDNSMVNVCENRLVIDPLSEEQMTVGITLPDGDLSGYKFVVYLWKDFEFMNQLIGHKEI